jgi:winged helix DNA-binding protein
MLDRRLWFQSLARPRFERAEDVVEWFGAVQSQDFAAAKWAVAQRTRSLSDADVERAINSGTVLRTHVLRPTWHFAPAKDIRWMLALTAPRIRASMARLGHWFGLAPDAFPRANRAIAKALSGGRQMTRAELGPIVRQRTGALGHVLAFAELDGLICSGALRGKEHTYALLDERVPATRPIERDEALALLARRYFRSHGPATFKDFVWWSGLLVSEARQAIAGATSLVAETIGGTTYWLSDKASGVAQDNRVHLLPSFDEYLVAYVDRSHAAQGLTSQVALSNVVVADGRVAGTWRRTISASAAVVDVTLFSRVRKAGLERAVERFGAFHGRAASFRV